MSMDKLTGIKIKYENGTYSDQIPVGAFAVNVGWDSTHTLVDIIGDIDIATDGSLQDQIDALLTLVNTAQTAANTADGKAVAAQTAVNTLANNTYTKTQVDAMIPTTLPNPQKLTINNTEYDGSTAVTVTVGSDIYNANLASVEFGANSSVTSTNSFAGGNGAQTTHATSFAFGQGVQTGKINQIVFGKYNAADSGASLVVGVGTDNSTRANAFTAGNDTVNNYITIGTKKITDIDAGILKKLTPSRNLCVVDDAHLAKPDFWTGNWDGPWKNTKGFTCNQPSHLAADGGGFWYHLQAGTYTFGCDVSYRQTTTTQVYYIFHFSPDSNPTALTNLTERILTEELAPRIELTFTLSEAGTLIFRPTSYANSGYDYPTRYENVQIEVGNMATEYEAYRDYYTIGDALIATGSTAPTSTLAGNIYMANGFAYGPDETTFSKLITNGDLTHDATNSAIVYTVPFLTFSDLEETSSTTLTSALAEAWLKYVVIYYGSEIGTRPVIGQLGTTGNLIATIVGSASDFNTTNTFPTRSSFIATDGANKTYRFYTASDTFYFNELSGGASGSYLPLSGGTLTGLVTSNYSIGGNTAAAFVAQHGVSSRDAGFKARRTDTDVSIRLIVGSGGVNHGVYSDTLGKWMVYGDASSVHLNGNADTSSAVLDYANGTVTKLGYSTARMTSFTHLACWDTSVSGEYRLRSAVPQDLRNLMGLGNTTGALPIANGGTGASTVAGAMLNLGAVYRNANSYSSYKSEKQSTFINMDAAETVADGVTFPRYAKGALVTNSSTDATAYVIDPDAYLYVAFRNSGTWSRARKYGSTSLYNGTLSSGSATLTNGMKYDRLLILGQVGTNPYFWTSIEVPTSIITSSDQGFGLAQDDSYCSFNLKYSGNNVIITWRGQTNTSCVVKRVFGVN